MQNFKYQFMTLRLPKRPYHKEGPTKSPAPSRVWPGAVITGFAVLALSTLSVSAEASNLVLNGSFEDTPTVGTGPFDGVPCTTILTPCISVPNWTTLSNPAVLLTTGISGNVSTYLDGGGSIPAADGANFVGSDGSCCTLGPLSQTLAGLTVGQTYTLSFEQAAAQLSGNFGATTEQWIVTIGGSISGSPTTVLLSDGITPYNPAYVVNSPDDQWRTPVISNVSGGFSGWQTESMTFTANATTELLAFLAVGTPIGAPPFVLLDNVSVQANTPEPESFALALLGALLLGTALFWKRRKKRA